MILYSALRENAVDAALHARWRGRGWGPGGPAEAAPALPRADQARYLAGDLGSSVVKRLIR